MSNSDKSIPITKPVFGERELELMRKPIESGWVVQGPYVERFENAISEYTQIKHCLAVSSGTAALHLALCAMGIGPGDEVILPSFTYVATANAVEYVGARPVFCDIDLSTFNLNLEDAKQKLTERTKAIIAVSQFGLACVDDELLGWASSSGLKVVEDAACALGSRIGGLHAGSRATVAAFSFHPRKTITTGEGGMVATNDRALADKVGRLRNHGANATVRQRHDEVNGSLLPGFPELGFNYRLTDIQGALGVAQSERLQDILRERREAASRYNSLLKENSSVICPSAPHGSEHSYQSYVVVFKGDDSTVPSVGNVSALNRRRNGIMAEMQKDDIGVRQGTHAVHSLGYYANKYGHKHGDLPNSYLAEQLSIALPLFAGITLQQQKRVVSYL